MGIQAGQQGMREEDGSKTGSERESERGLVGNKQTNRGGMDGWVQE